MHGMSHGAGSILGGLAVCVVIVLVAGSSLEAWLFVGGVAAVAAVYGLANLVAWAMERREDRVRGR